MRLEMVIGMEIRILNDHHSSVFKQLIWKETWTSNIPNSDFHCDGYFVSDSLGSGLYPKGGEKNPPRIQDKPDRRPSALLAVSWIGHGRGGVSTVSFSNSSCGHMSNRPWVCVCAVRERARARAQERERKYMSACLDYTHVLHYMVDTYTLSDSL
jgi:hypothetical protein